MVTQDGSWPSDVLPILWTTNEPINMVLFIVWSVSTMFKGHAWRKNQIYCSSNVGHSYAVTVDKMSYLHSVQISLRSLKSKLNEAGLYCRKNFSSANTIIRAIRLELGAGQLFGCRMLRQVHKQKYNLRVKRDHVMNLPWELNPRGCERRARRRFVRRTYRCMGPNYMWHADGYDKFLWKLLNGWPFQYASMWFACGSTNNDPEVITHYLLSRVRNLGVNDHYSGEWRMKQAEQKIIYETTNEIAPSHGVHNSCVVLVVHSGHRKICFDFLLPSLPSPLPSFFPFFSPLSLPSFLPSSFLDLRTTGGFDGVFNGSREHQYLLRYCFGDVI